ncbi:hypothetical protein FRC10_008189, partial [Ceratobasidium sp. 414]
MSESPNRYIFPPPSRTKPYLAEVGTLRADILEDVRALGHVGNIYVERMAYCKRTANPQHEFLAFYVCDKIDSRKNVLILDRVPTVGLSTRPGVGGVAQGTPVPRFRSISFPSLSSSDSHTQISSNPLSPRPADDKFTVAVTGDSLGVLCASRWPARGGYKVEHTHDIRHQNLTIEMVVVLACSVSAHHRQYTLMAHQCYWFADAVWTIACTLAGINNAFPTPGNTGTNMVLLLPCTPGVPAGSVPEVLLPIYRQEWGSFCTEVNKRRARPAAQLEAANVELAATRETARLQAEDLAAAQEMAQVEARGRAAAEKELESLRLLIQASTTNLPSGGECGGDPEH